ncbi:putative hydrolases or acyltransferase [Aspergillus violaceofuscus CBS 115571]|uniref:Putative hydrolases or acyltransferase n=1 Tax=Aspergillus violaceofuscus (strain CBS 115571) TaxID=1450538 RepID=A0A2V5H2R4_ASPV1|nr:putative hydrolases or acyltransferase [Aspergillus violaceofuscus CBS 115571]
MSSTPPPQTIPLPQTFHHTTTTHTHTIHYTTLGDPSHPPLIFIHGTPWSSFVWHDYALTLARTFHVHLFDNPGFGHSPLGTPLPSRHHNPETTKAIALDADLSDQTAVFAALYTHWSQAWPPSYANRAHVIAHDHGGLMSLRAHLLHGIEYASLCLINVVALGPFGQPLFKLVAENETVFEALTGPVFEGVVEAYIRDAAFTELSKEMMGMLKEPWVRRGEEGRKGFVRQMVQANSRSTEEVEGRYGEVGAKMPVLVVWGVEDRWIPAETAGRLKDSLNAREVVLIEGAGHLVMYDQPGRLGVELGLWLNSVQG